MSKRSDSRKLCIESLESRDLMSVNMAPYDQLLLELINRARANPNAEATQYGIDLNQGLSPGTISSAPKQPLAPNQILINAAGAHSQDMLDNNFFSHTNLAGQSPSERAQAAGYPTWVGENIAWGGSTGSINQISHVYARHENLFESPGHRQNMLGISYEEIGVGVRFGSYTYSGTTYNSSMVTEKFGSPGINPVITGVVFTDAADGSANDDDFYSVGEQVGSGTITATNTSTAAVFTTNIGSSGGYALQVVAGTYNVVAMNGATGQSYVVSSVVVTNENVKVDFETTTTGGTGNAPPSLQMIADVQFPLTQSSWNTSLAATDPDSGQLIFSANVENLAYHLDATLGLSMHASIQENWGGLGEKWLQGAGGTSYYLTPSGQFFEWDGSVPGSLSGELVATLSGEYYLDVGQLYSAQPGLNGVTATVSGTSLNLDMDSTLRGTFVVTVTVSDGALADAQSFHVTKGFRLAHHSRAENLGLSMPSTFQQHGGVGDAWQQDARLLSYPILRAAGFDLLQNDSTGSTKSLVRTINTGHHDSRWHIQDGRSEYLHERVEINGTHERSVATKRISKTPTGIDAHGDEPLSGSVDTTTLGNDATLNDTLRPLDDVFDGWYSTAWPAVDR